MIASASIWLKPLPASNAGYSTAILILACARVRLLQAFSMPGRAVGLVYYPLFNDTALEDCVSCKPVFILRNQPFWIVIALWLGNFFTTFRRNISPSSSRLWVLEVSHDQKYEGGLFFRTSGISHFKWPKYIGKNSRFLCCLGNESYVNDVYIFIICLFICFCYCCYLRHCWMIYF